jgi:hypothetical protein
MCWPSMLASSLTTSAVGLAQCFGLICWHPGSSSRAKWLAGDAAERIILIQIGENGLLPVSRVHRKTSEVINR